MPSRKFHGKSRHGCKTCKRRKVRCDLARPTCDNCSRLSRECVYADELSTSVALAQRSAPSQQSREDSHSGTLSESIPPSLPIVELELMHQFTSSTIYSMSDNLAYMPTWQTVFPRLAFQNHYILHGILSLSALHLRHQKTGIERAQLLDLARHHQQEGLKSYIPLLTNITPENCHALFACSQITASISFALLSIPEENPSTEAFIKGITGMFRLVLGAAGIATQGAEWLRQGELGSMLGHGPALLDWNNLPLTGEPQQALEALLERISMLSPKGLTPGSVTPEAETTAACYNVCIEKLKPLFPRPPGSIPKMSTVIGWPVFLDKAYIGMLENHDAAALVILAYYGVTLHKLNHIWWLEGVGSRLVQSISEVVSGDWAPYLIWANGEVFKDA